MRVRVTAGALLGAGTGATLGAGNLPLAVPLLAGGSFTLETSRSIVADVGGRPLVGVAGGVGTVRGLVGATAGTGSGIFRGRGPGVVACGSSGEGVTTGVGVTTGAGEAPTEPAGFEGVTAGVRAGVAGGTLVVGGTLAVPEGAVLAPARCSVRGAVVVPGAFDAVPGGFADTGAVPDPECVVTRITHAPMDPKSNDKPAMAHGPRSFFIMGAIIRDPCLCS